MSDAAFSAWGEALWRASWQGALAILAVLAILRAVPAVPPSLRCWLWRIAYGKLVVSLFWSVPLVLPVLPGESVTATIPSASVRPGLQPLADRPVGQAKGAALRSGDPRAPTLPDSNVPAVLVTLWLLGFGASTVRLLFQARRLEDLRRSCRPAEDGDLLRLCRGLCDSLGIHRAPLLRLSDRVERPMVVGAGRPEVLFPAAFLRACDEEDRRLVLAHELAHVRRRDLQWEWLRVAVWSLFFFHPLVWLADREWRFTQELACDELTLEVAATSPAEYGRLLLRVASLPGATQAATPALGLGESFEALRRRLRALGSSRRLSPAASAAAGMTVFLVGVTVIVPWRAVASTAVAYLDLRPVANHRLDEDLVSSAYPGNNLAEVPRGEQVFAGFRFQVSDRYLQLGGTLHPGPEQVGPIPVGRRLAALAFLHGTAWGAAEPGKANHVPDGTRIGEYRVHYRDGGTEVIPVVYGEDVRDWWVPDRPEAPLYRGRAAWTGENAATKRFDTRLRLYVTRWKNPRPGEEVTHLDYRTAGTTCAPFCVALTCGG